MNLQDLKPLQAQNPPLEVNPSGGLRVSGLGTECESRTADQPQSDEELIMGELCKGIFLEVQ